MREIWQAVSLAALAVATAGAQTNFGSVNLGQSATATATLTVPAAATAGTVSVVTQGAAGLDFSDAGTGSCAAGANYAAGQTCTVDVLFKPVYAGTRYGQAALRDATGKTIALANLVGVGIGPQVTFNPAPAVGILALVYGVPLNNPFGVAVDGKGDLYIADNRNGRVVEMPAGGGTPIAVAPIIDGKPLIDPGGVAVDGAGNLYISDLDGDVIQEVPADGSAPISMDPSVSGRGLSYPCGMVADSVGNLYVADVDNARVLEMPAGGTPVVVDASVDGSPLIYPVAVALDSAGDLYISDYFANRVVKVPAGGGSAVAINPAVNGQGLTLPYGIAVDAAGNLFIADALNRVVEVPADGSAAFAIVPSANGVGLNDPIGIALDGAGNLFIADSFNNRVVEVERGQAPVLNFAATAAGATSSDSPQTVLAQNGGNAALSFPIPVSGQNPAITQAFILGSGGAGDCAVETASTGTATTLASGASCLLAISFQPMAAGIAAGTLTMVDNSMNAVAPGYATQTISLSGNAPVVTLSAPRVDFAPQAVGSSSGMQHLTLTNTGSATLNISGIAITGADAAAFGITNGCGSTLAVAASCTIDADFAPSALGAMTAAVTITGNANSSPLSLPLSGQGVFQASVTVTPANQSITTAQALAVTVAVAGESGNATPTGSATLTSGTYDSGPVSLTAGVATISVPAGSLPAGTDSLTAAYAPDQASVLRYAGGSGSTSITVTTAPVVTAPAASTGAANSITYSSATVAGTVNPNGADTQVWFVYSDSSTLAGASQTTSQDIGSGTAPVPVSANLANLDDSLTIYYRVVAQNSAGTTNGAISTFVTPPAPYFSIAPGAPVSINPGATTGNASTVTVAPWFWFTGTVTLSCAITPSTETDPPSCSVPASVTINGSTSQMATITVMTTAPSTTSAGSTAGSSWPWGVGGAALACILWRRKRGRAWPAISVVTMIAVMMLAVVGGCGGSTASVKTGPPPNPGTTAGAYTITVTAISQGTTQTTSIALTVQ
jgi:sugar lactone lactonase YvrE